MRRAARTAVSALLTFILEYNILMKYLIGIDEAGRGPLAGPVSVGAVLVEKDFDFSLVAGVKDSKLLAPLQQDKWYARIEALRDAGNLRFAVAFSSAEMIDDQGIMPSIFSALRVALSQLNVDPHECEVRLDGGLKAPEEFRNQRTIIRGDQTEAVISLAAIAAKVERDQLMNKLAQKYPLYGFDQHKGYGTRSHRALISAHGVSPVHRTTFCTALLNGLNTV
jgi:ribonuclease HII